MSQGKDVYVLGLSIGVHDTGACLVRNGEIVCAAEEERFDRVRHSASFPFQAIKFCLKTGGIRNVNAITEVCVGYDLMERAKARFDMRFSKSSPELSILVAEQSINVMRMVQQVRQFFEGQLGYKRQLVFYKHHIAHAAACFYASPFNKAAVLVVDGAGERDCVSIYNAIGSQLKPVFQIAHPNSIGRFYAWITDYLGFRHDADEGKTMGLASYGTLKLLRKMRRLVQVRRDGTYQLHMEYFNFQNSSTPGLSHKFFQEFGPPRKTGEPITQYHKDIARAAQHLTEEVMLGLAKLARRLTGQANLVVGGGVALNSVANGKIAAAELFKSMYVYPAAGDGGTAVGAALFGYFSRQKKKVARPRNQSPYVGYEATRQEIVKALKTNQLLFTKPHNLPKTVAAFIAQDKIVGWYQGRAEIGPRALGNRSILANPCKEPNRDRVNTVKHREQWRPFAPSILAEHAEEFFDMNGLDSPYMIMAQGVKMSKRKYIPAVTHIDGTARVQTVTKQMNLRYWELIVEFYRLTGVPVVLNTSFNLAGEPIVNTPEQAVQAFIRSALDVLVLGDYIVVR